MLNRPREGTAPVYVALVFWSALAGCYEPESERLSCDDVLPAGSYDFSQLQALVQDRRKGCLRGGCHVADTQPAGIRLDTPELVYDELAQRPEKFYAALASGFMPEQGRPWSDDDLKLFRSWYCSGAFPP
jgi:hypothetical protein